MQNVSEYMLVLALCLVPLSVLPPLVLEENLWDKWHRLFYKLDVMPFKTSNHVQGLTFNHRR